MLVVVSGCLGSILIILGVINVIGRDGSEGF